MRERVPFGLICASICIAANAAAAQPIATDAIERRVVQGDRAAGRAAIVAHGCGTCHVIPGIGSARGRVGPSLRGFSERIYVGGVLPNNPQNLVNWLMDPPRYSPETAMPDMNIGETTAKDIAAWLYEGTR